MFNRPSRPLPPWERYLFKILRSTFLAAALIGGSLTIGAMGYHGFEGLPWLDSYLNAAMILTGMGPVDKLTTEGGKLFAIAYALFSGVVFLSAAAVQFAPVIHRYLHRFHLDMQDAPEDSRPD